MIRTRPDRRPDRRDHECWPFLDRAETMPTMSALVLESVITCPRCGARKTETMPTDACQFFYECSQCQALLRPNAGDCCVFCSFGSVKCPPIQQQSRCCG